MKFNFRSDNESPAAAAVFDAVQSANSGRAYAYAEDDWSGRLDAAFSELFDTSVRALPVSTGTVANSIALGVLSPPWGSVYCHRNAHVLNDESGAPEFFGNGLRLVPVDGANGKFEAETMAALIRRDEGHGVHSYRPSAVSLTQCTESGTVYTPQEIRAIAGEAGRQGLAVHMDGARFGNAVVSLDCHPADITWRAGVQLLSFGASKNGCLAAEALLFFDHQDRLDDAERHRKRSGHLLSKMRYLSAQLLAYLEDGLWLGLAGQANDQAARFAAAVESHPGAKLEFPVEANEVFVRWRPEGFEALRQAGMEFLTWPGRDDLARFVFSHATTSDETAALCRALEESP
jgi:threonine aldolase